MNIRALFFLSIICLCPAVFSQDTTKYPEEQKMSIDVKDTDLRDVIK